jgi:hypothetical protein
MFILLYVYTVYMNQIQIQQKQTAEQRMLEKANILVKNKRVKRSTVQDSRNVWMVGSFSTPKKWYVVRWNEELDCFTCACKAFKFSSESNNLCLHILACSLYEGGLA